MRNVLNWRKEIWLYFILNGLKWDALACKYQQISCCGDGPLSQYLKMENLELKDAPLGKTHCQPKRDLDISSNQQKLSFSLMTEMLRMRGKLHPCNRAEQPLIHTLAAWRQLPHLPSSAHVHGFTAVFSSRHLCFIVVGAFGTSAASHKAHKLLWYWTCLI